MVLTQRTQRAQRRKKGTTKGTQMLKIGDKAPDFKLKSDTGGEASLQDFKGKRVVLFFFPKANTPG